MFEHTEKIKVLGKWLVFNEPTNSNLAIAKIDASNRWVNSRVKSKLMLGRKFSHIVGSDNGIPDGLVRKWNLQRIKSEFGSNVNKALITLANYERVTLFTKLYPQLTIEPI